MMGQKHCPYCQAPARQTCSHLALAAEGRDFVSRCVEYSHSEGQWRTLCARRRGHLQRIGEWAPEREDFTWLETAFCDEFLKPLRWFGAMDYEWRNGAKPGQGGFHVLLWSKEPQRLWWELQDELERLSGAPPSSPPAGVPANAPQPPALFPVLYPPPGRAASPPPA
jgi:hypothetical protein